LLVRPDAPHGVRTSGPFELLVLFRLEPIGKERFRFADNDRTPRVVLVAVALVKAERYIR
jgi:hypothetical protein